jgi:hypothetical protein
MPEKALGQIREPSWEFGVAMVCMMRLGYELCIETGFVDDDEMKLYMKSGLVLI